MILTLFAGIGILLTTLIVLMILGAVFGERSDRQSQKKTIELLRDKSVDTVIVFEKKHSWSKKFKKFNGKNVVFIRLPDDLTSSDAVVRLALKVDQNYRYQPDEGQSQFRMYKLLPGGEVEVWDEMPGWSDRGIDKSDSKNLLNDAIKFVSSK